jgi:hypothetical protein
MVPRILPIGIQDFVDLRQRGFLYVDKTAYIYRLAAEGKPYFLSRPRCFGKSLLLSVIKAYFQGKRELFEAGEGRQRLAIADLETEWAEYPVIHVDLSGNEYKDREGLEVGLNINLLECEQVWGGDSREDTAAARFRGLIRRACEKTGRRVVILIDEYDKPLLETLDNPEMNERIRNSLRAFYGVLKAADPWLRFVFLKTERYYQGIFYVLFTLMGQFAGAELRSAAGRADAVVITKDRVYVFEFKLAGSGTAAEALWQIEEKGYLIPWSAGSW